MSDSFNPDSQAPFPGEPASSSAPALSESGRSESGQSESGQSESGQSKSSLPDAASAALNEPLPPAAPPLVILRGGFQENYSYEDFQRDCNSLYDYLGTLRKNAPQADLLERFQTLFIDGSDYSEPGILAALHRIVNSRWADIEFDHVINRCCYILINYWWSKSGLEQGTPQLVSLFDVRRLQATPLAASSPTTQRLRELVTQFTYTEQCAVLQDRARTVLHRPDPHRSDSHGMTSAGIFGAGGGDGLVGGGPRRIREFIPRYPFLYSHLFMNWDSSAEGQYAIKRLQVEKESRYEQALHRYTTGLLRGSRLTLAGGPEAANPTLLSNQQLATAVRQYAGRIEGARTYQDTADRLWFDVKRAGSMRAAKGQLHDYLTASVASKYGKHRFNRWLQERLFEVHPQHDTLKPNASLLTQSCVHLLDALLVSPRRLPDNHMIFLDFNTYAGATLTVGFLLKVMLLCRSMTHRWEAIRSYVARHFAVMLKHYETGVHHELEWLIDCLENLQVAFSIHSGRTDFSWVKLL
jgi:hypothetical protein